MSSTKHNYSLSGKGSQNEPAGGTASSRSASSATSMNSLNKTVDVDLRSINTEMSSDTLVNNASKRSWKQKLFRSSKEKTDSSATSASSQNKDTAEREKEETKRRAGDEQESDIKDQLERKYPQTSLYAPTGLPTNARLL